MSTNIKLQLFDTTAVPDSTPSVNNKQPFVDIDTLKDELIDYPQRATLELNQWASGYELFPDVPSADEFRYWSEEQSDENGDITNFPVLDISFGSVHTSIGITLNFWDKTEDYAKDITIDWYDSSNTLIDTKDFEVNRAIYFADNLIENFKRVKITFKSTNKPYRYIKLQRVDYGISLQFDDTNLESAKLLEEVNLTSEEVSINTINFNTLFDDTTFAQSVYTTTQAQQKVIVNQTVNGTIEDMGTFYITTNDKADDYHLNFNAQDFLGVIDNTTFVGGMYTNVTVTSLMAEIMADYPDMYSVSDDIKDLTISGYIPICSHREAIQRVAIAVNAVVDCSRSDLINIYRLDELNAKIITKDNRFSYKETEEQIITGLKLSIDKYALTSERIDGYEVYHDIGQYIVYLSEPLSNLVITGATILSSGVNYAIINVTSIGTVKITGLKYNNSQKISFKFMDDKPNDIVDNIVEIQNTLEWDMTQNINHLFTMITMNLKADIRAILSTEKAGDYTNTPAVYNNTFNGYITSNNIDLLGGYVGEVEAHGLASTSN